MACPAYAELFSTPSETKGIEKKSERPGQQSIM